jgi:two-component system chemotaxis response regulator CheB
LLTESEASCVVYGMPRVVKEAGYSRAEASIEDMAATILRPPVAHDSRWFPGS